MTLGPFLARTSPESSKQSPVNTDVRERRIPEQVRTDASTRVSRLQVALDTLTDGDVEEHPISKPRFNGCVLSWRKCRLPRHRSAHQEFRFVSRCVERKGLQTSIHRDDSFRSTGPRQMDGGQTQNWDAIEFGDQESILADLIHTGAAQLKRFPSIVSNMVT